MLLVPAESHMGGFAYLLGMGAGSIDQQLGVAASELWAMNDLAEFRAGVLSVMRRLIAADSASYNEISRRPPEALVIGDPPGSLGVLTTERRQRFAELIWQNPLAAHFARTGDASTQRMSDFISRRELHRLEIYDLIYRELGTEHQLAFTLPANGHLIGITLNRCGAQDFSDEDRELLDWLRSLVIPLHRNLLDRARLQAVLGALECAGANGGALAVLLVHPSGALEAAHDRAERLLGALAEERVVLQELHDWACLQRRHRGTTRQAESLLLTLRSRELLARYVYGRPGALDAIALCAGSRPTPDLLRGLGLTPRQARVLQLLWEGATNAEIALALTLSEHTVRHHLEEVYRRLGVHSRAAAANLAARALRSEGGYAVGAGPGAQRPSGSATSLD